MTSVTATPVSHTPPTAADTPNTAALGYQRVVHQLARRELRQLAELATWADATDPRRAGELARHTDLVCRVLLAHHLTERDRLWPALFRALPNPARERARDEIADWTGRTALLDHELRALGTLARQWSVTRTARERDAFVRAGGRLADAVDAHTGHEEATLLPLLGRHLPAGEWTAIRRAARCPLARRERGFVLGLALEDACAVDRARLLAGRSPASRTAWRLVGRRRYRAAIVRLRGAPPAA